MFSVEFLREQFLVLYCLSFTLTIYQRCAKFMHYFSVCRRCQIIQTCFTRWGSCLSTDCCRQHGGAKTEHWPLWLKMLAVTTMYFGPQCHQMLFPNVFNLGLRRTFSSKFGIRSPLKIPPHLKHDATLPGEYMAPLCLTVGNGISCGPPCASSSSSLINCIECFYVIENSV